jgi:hypothetical protein
MTETLTNAHPDWTEFDLAAEGAKNLWKRGFHPALTLAGGQIRIEKFRHPVPTQARLGRKAMLVFCARKYGLYANLSRLVFFETPTLQEQKLKTALAQIESQALSLTQSKSNLNDIYHGIGLAYAEHGFAGEFLKHHQGGLTGYLAREIIATAKTEIPIDIGNAVAWNPSLPGAKIEDTVLVGGTSGRHHELEILTFDPSWPHFEWNQRKRPDFLVRS